MAKLYFRYGAMNSGKTTILIQTAYNYYERDQNAILIKPAIDTKGNDKVVSRLGVERKVDYLIGKEDKIMEKITDIDNVDCILVDEAQFLERNQVDELFYITKIYDIPVIAFGLRTDFRSNSFPGSQRLFELADEMIEMPTICRCGKKARFNARKISNHFVLEGDSIAIDNSKDIEYESLCGKCYIKKVLKR